MAPDLDPGAGADPGHDHEQALFRYLLRLADTAHVLSHRLGEHCGHAPVLEEDIALTNIALDLIGQARLFYQYAAEVEARDRSEDDLAFLRPERDMNNLLLVEQPNRDFAAIIARQFLFDTGHLRLMQALTASRDARIAEIAVRAVKEITYHRRHSAGWVVRLGDGTDESHRRMGAALNDHFGYCGEFFEMDGIDREMAKAGVGPDLSTLREGWEADIRGVLDEAGLDWPDQGWRVAGGRHEGRHTEHLGHLMAEMCFMQRTYPGLNW